MADEAFALSPISARAALPSDEDYAAISEAFMETSRGRWFLTEYAKRNRNADTRMVLDAVARIEQSLAAQKEETLQREVSLQREEDLAAHQAAAEAAAQAAAAAESRLTEALAAIGGAVVAAQESAVEAIDSLALEQRLAPVRKGARVLREIAWRLREIGNDGRICDLIDSQVAVIEKGTEQLSSEEARAALRAAFAALEGRVAEFGDNDPPAAPPSDTAAAMEAVTALEAVVALQTEASREAALEATAAPSPTPPEMPLATVAEESVEAASAPLPSQPATAEVALAEAEAVLAGTAEAFPASGPELAGAAVDADDEALLDAIAMEMGAPDPIDDEEIAEAAGELARAQEPALAEPEIEAVAPEPVAAPNAPPLQEAVQSLPAAEAMSADSMEASLGSTIIASGMLRKPASAANDPLAPIRRMSQAEKIAFFS